MGIEPCGIGHAFANNGLDGLLRDIAARPAVHGRRVVREDGAGRGARRTAAHDLVALLQHDGRSALGHSFACSHGTSGAVTHDDDVRGVVPRLGQHRDCDISSGSASRGKRECAGSGCALHK